MSLTPSDVSRIAHLARIEAGRLSEATDDDAAPAGAGLVPA